MDTFEQFFKVDATEHTDGYRIFEATAARGDALVQFYHSGEGYEDDFDPANLDDRPLYRFSIARKNENDVWDWIDSATYCTQIPCEFEGEIVQSFARRLLDLVYNPLSIGQSIRVICETASEWTADDFPAARAALDAQTMGEATRRAARTQQGKRL